VPVGIYTQYSPDEDRPLSSPNMPQLQLPNQQVDPFMRTLLDLQDAGLLSQRFMQDQIANPIMRQKFYDSGVVGPRQPFGPGQSGLTEDERGKLKNLRKNISIRNGDNTQFIPREHTETSGWIKLLEIFGAFNFAVAGATNAVVNLSQGETEETNPIVEAYRGLTLKDKEVFADVLENLGWEGEDGYAYWSRETLGFVLDVVTDPINFISFGSAQTARLAKGIATNVPLRGKAILAGKKFTPVEELNKVALSIVDEGLEALKRGEAFQLGGNAAQKKANDLAEIVKKNLDPTVELDDVTAAVGEVQEGVARLSLEDSISQDVNAVFAMLSKHNDVRTLRRLIEEGRGSPEQLSAFLQAVGGDTTGEISHAVLKHFLDMEGKDVTIDNVMDFLTNLTGGMRSMIDPGGLQIRAPFSQSGIVIAEAQWLDEFALAVETGILKAMGAAAQYTPGPIRNATKAVAETVSKFGKSASYQVSRAFGANARRSGVLNARLLARHNAIKEAQVLSEGRTQQTLTWAPDGTDQPLPADLYEVVVDTVLAEQDSAINHLRSGERFFTREAFDAEIERLRRTGDPADAARAEQMELQARNTPPGYTEQHIPLMSQDPRLQGYTPEQVEQLQETVRRIHREFTEVYDESAAHGMAMEFMEYYLPLNYSNWQKVENISLQPGSEFGRVQGEDPFSRVRSLTREEADSMGLVANKNLYAIVYSRLFAAKRAQIERTFVTKLVDDLGVHPGQVGNVLRRMYGPKSELGNDLVRALMSEASYEDLITPENLGVMIPDLDTFKTLIQTGKFEQALTWLQGREDLLPLLASGDGSAKFLDAVNSDLNAGLGTVNTFMDSLFSSQGGLLQAEDGITSALAGSMDELEQLITDVGAEEAGAPAIASVIRQLMKERLEAANIAVPGVSPIDLLQRSSRGNVFEVGAESQADTVRLAVLMNAIDDAEDAGLAIRQKLLEKAPNIEQAVNKAVDDLVERIRAARDVDDSIITDQLEQQILEMALSAVPGISLERFVAKSALFPEGTVAAQATSKMQAIYDLEIKLSDDSITAATAQDIQKEIIKKTDEMLAEYARHPEITRWYDTWRKSHGLPPDPNIPDISRRQELRNHIINAMKEARIKAEKSNLSIFRLPVYAPGGKTPQGQARISAIKSIKNKIDSLGDNGEKYADMLDLVMSPSTAMPGFTFNPLAAMRSATLDLYGDQASAVINLIQDTAAALKPHTIVTEIYGAKAKWTGLVRNLVGQPDNLIAELESLSKATVNRISTALTKIPGMGDETARSLVRTFQTEMDNILVTRMKGDELLTDVHEATLSAFNQLKEGLEAVVVSTEGRDLMLGMIDQMGRQLIESNQVVISLLSRARSVSDDILKLVDNPTAIIAASTDDVIGIVDELVAIRDDLQKKIIQSDEDTRRLLTSNNPEPAGWDQITEPELNSNMLLGEAQQLHDDMRGVFGENQELLDAFERSQLEIAKDQQTRAKAALEAIDRDVRATEGKVNDLVMQLRFVEQAGERQQEIMTRLKPIFMGDDPPEGWILYQNFAELAVIDEFMKGDDFSRVGWVAAAEKIAISGPSDGTLKWYFKSAGLNEEANKQQLLDTVQRIAAGAPLDPENARIYAAQRRPAFLEQPGPEDLQQALTGVIESAAPGLLDELGIVAKDIILKAEATARSGTGFGDETSRLIGRMTEAAFLPDAEVRELAEAIGYERRFIDALIKQIQAKSGIVEGLYAMKTDAGRAAIAPFKNELAQTLQRADLDADTAQELLGNVDMLTSELIVLASSDMAGALNRLSEITGFEPLQMQNLIADLDKATSLISRTNVTQGVKRMLKDINKTVEDLYRPMATALDDVSDARVLNTQGVPQFFKDYLDTHPNDPLSSFLAEGTALPNTPGVDFLDSAEMSALEDLLRDVNGPDFGESEPLLLQLQNMMNGVEQGSQTNTPNRAMYWLHRLKQLNNGTSANGPITQEQANNLLTGLDRYFERGKPKTASDAAKKKLVETRIPDARSDAAKQYESRAVLTNEVQALDEAIPQMETRTFVEDTLDYTPEQKAQWRGIYQMQNYLKLQIQRSEQMALHKVLMDLPSRAEMNYMLLRHQLGNLDAPAEQLEKINNMRLAGAGRGVMTPEQTAAIDEITTGRRVMLESAGELVFERAGNPIKTLLNIDIQDMDIDYEAGAVSQQFLKKVQEFLDELPEDQFALLGGSEGLRLVQGEDGSLIVANAAEAAGVVTDANASLVNAVAQVHDYLKLVEDTSGAMTGVPALEIQKKQLTRALDSFFSGDTIEATDQKRLLLQAVIGHQNIDKLSAAEASAVINYLQTNVKPDVTSFGRSSRASMQRADRVMLGLRDRGLLPRKLEARWQKGELSDEELLKEYQKLGSEMDVNDPERPVSLRFPGMARIMENGIDLSGKDLGQPITVPKWMADAVADAVAPEREFGPVLRGMLRSADALTNSFKWAMTLPWPAFHARNIMDATVRSMFALGTKSLSPTWNRKMLNIMQGGDEIVTINGVQYRSDVLLEMFEKLGGQVNFADKIGQTSVAMIAADPRILSPFSDNFVMRGANSLADTASTIAGKGDNFFRLSIWLKNMEEGMGATDAMAYAQKFLFDYANGLSPFERNVMRRLFPFYTFSRFNVPLQLGLMFKRPGMISLMGKTQNLFSQKRTDPIDTLLPSYVREQWRFGPQINNGQLQIWTGRNLLATEELGFLGDLATWRGQSTPDILFDEVFARLNPMLKIPVELYIGKNLYFDSKISQDQTIRGAILDWPVIRDYLDMRKVRIGSGADTRVLYRVNGHRYHLLNQLHFSRLYRTVVSIAGDEDSTFFQSLVPFFTGLRLTSIDLSRRMQHLESVSNFNQEKIRKALNEGDFVAAQRILDLTERQPYQQLELNQAVSALEGLAEQTSR
jgi:hypothetical protein